MSIGLAGPVACVLAYEWLSTAGPMALPGAVALAAVFQLGVSGFVMSRLGVTLRAGHLVLLAAALALLARLARAIAAWPI
jgi:hypothetical protein